MESRNLRFLVAALAATALLLAPSAWAVHNIGLFQLDRDAYHNLPVPPPEGDDWDLLYGQLLNHSLVYSFVPDPAGFSIFTTGGSKDISDVSQWQWTDGNVPDKDEITNAYAALYQNGPGGHFIVYFGLDRYANNGDAQIGFWFLQAPTYLCGLPAGNTNAPPGGCADKLIGRFVDASGNLATHTDGDVLVLVHFTGGGAIVEEGIFKWVAGAPSNPVAITPAADDVYAVVNQADTDSPWSYQAKDGKYSANVFPPGSFFEAGIDLTSLVPNATCFSNFVAETRSSQELTAQLKDMAFGRFETCGVSVEKTGPALSKIGDEITYHYVISNTGISPMYLVSAVDQSNRTAADSVNLVTEVPTPSGCDTLQPMGMPGDSCSFDWPYTPVEGDPDPLENTVTVTYNSSGPPEFTGVAYLATDDLSINMFQPSVEVTKTADKTDAMAGDVITYTFTVHNTSSADSPSLVFDSMSDTGNGWAGLGDLAADAGTAGCGTLSHDASCTFTKTYTVQEGDPDPLENTVTVHYHPTGFPNDITDSDTHYVNLFEPGVQVVKTGDTLSKIGDDVTYHFVITNTGSADSPAIVLDSVVDDKIGTLTSTASGAGCGTLAPGASCNFDVPWTIPVGAADPYVNTVTVHYHLTGTATDVTDSDFHEINLFTAEFEISKSGPSLSKIGDEVTYTYTIHNLSSSDAPALNLSSLSDDRIGSLVAAATTAGCDVLSYDETCSFTRTWTIPADAADPYVNTVTATYGVDGFPNTYTHSTSWSINLFTAEFEISKSGPSQSKIGDDVTYTYTIHNLSSDDAPVLNLSSLSDDRIGSLVAEATSEGCNVLTYDETCSFTKTWTIPADASDPYVNTVTATYGVAGFPNTYTHTASWSIDLFTAEFEISKSGPTLSKIGDEVTYTYTIHNLSSSDAPVLNLSSLSDDRIGSLVAAATTAGCDVLSYDETCSFTKTWTIPGDAGDPYVNTVTATYGVAGFPNTYTHTASWSINLFTADFEISKSGPSLSKIGDDVTYTYTIHNLSSEDAPVLNLSSLSDDRIGSLAAAATTAGCDVLTYDETCSFTKTWTIPADAADPYVNTVTATYGVAGFPNTYTHTASWSIDLFTAEFEISKSGPTLSKIGDEVTYTYTIHNLSSSDAPALNLSSLSDDRIGSLVAAATTAGCDVLSYDETCSFNRTWTIPADAADPYVNTVTATYGVAGFPNTYTHSAMWSVNLFQPSITLGKTGDAYSKAGDEAHYTITLANTSSADTPDMVCTITDALLGLSKGVTLASGGTDVTNVSRVVLAGDPDPLVNTASVSCSPTGFPNVLSTTASHSTDLVHPDFTVAKDCISDQPVPPGASANFRIVVSNTGDVPLVFHVVDTTLGIDDTQTVANGGVLTYEQGIIATGTEVFNSVDVNATLPAEYNLSNSYDKSASATCLVGGGATRTPGFWKTHLDYATHVFNVHLVNTDTNADTIPDATVIDLGWKTVTSIEEAMGIFWANPARESNDDKRDRLCQARELASFQAMAAILNSGLSNGAGLPVSLAEIASILGGTDVKAIQNLAGLLDTYNNSGDPVAIVDIDGYMIQHADPNGAKDIADIPFADCP